MGVPKFAAWLTKKYPTMVGRVCPPDVHGLYIDLNGLIHPCCHDEEDPTIALRPEQEKLRQICLAVETLVVTTRPRQVIYIAVDGVAPRAKMNQQRARRYMSSAAPVGSRGGGLVASLEAEFSQAQTDAAARELDAVAQAMQADALYGGDIDVDKDDKDAGEAPSPDSPLLPAVEDLLEDMDRARPAVGLRGSGEADAFDANCISPGTAFMAKVSEAMRAFIEEKLIAKDPLWGHTTVVFSDASTPGEGEHKLLDFLRTQASFSGFNGRGSHVIAGLDADLIFLSLSLHIPHVYLLRDNKRPSSFDKPRRGGAGRRREERKPKAEADASASEGVSSLDGDEEGVVGGADPVVPESAAAAVVTACTTYEYYDVDVVGASLVSEMYLLSQLKGFRMKADVRASADGELIASNGYCFDRVTGRPDGAPKGSALDRDAAGFHPCLAVCNSKIVDDFIVLAMIMGNDFIPRVPSAFCGESAMDNIMEVYVGEVLPYGYLTLGNHEIDLRQLARFFRAYAKVEAVKFRQFCLKSGAVTAEECAAPLGSAMDDLWREPYYASTTVTHETRTDACRAYIEGLRFVWRYYSTTSTQVSWSWYYPYHHGPLAYDLYLFLERQGPNVQTTLPPPPLETQPPEIFAQQLCILPPTSKALVPEIFRHYMTSPPEELRATFPKEWDVDTAAAYGKDHLAAVLLPFANMERLVRLVRDFQSHFTEAERARQVSNDFHLVLRRVPAAASGHDSGGSDVADAVEEVHGEAVCPPHAATRPPGYVFEIAGGGLSPLSPARMPAWSLRTDCAELKYFMLRETTPERCRPRTYSYSVPIPHLTVAEDGKAVRPARRSRGGGVAAAAATPAGGSHRDAPDVSAGSGSSLSAGRAAAAALPNFVEFALCAGAFGFCALAWVMPVTAVAVKLQALGLLAAVLIMSYTCGFAVGSAGSRKGSGVRRNSIRMTFVDWQCGSCLSLNFARNNRCFVCAAPFDEHHDWALFSGKNTPDPPLMDPDHRPYLVRYGRID